MTTTVAVLNGNLAAAWAARLSRPDVIAAYPITPQTPVVEYLTQFRADGELDCQMSEVESEHSAMSILTGASLTGVRCYTATSSQGPALMYEPYFSGVDFASAHCHEHREPGDDIATNGLGRASGLPEREGRGLDPNLRGGQPGNSGYHHSGLSHC